MPIYAYRCSNCGHAQDVLQRMSDPVLTVCPACGQPSYVKQVTAAGFQLKGSGWYVTDFRGGDKPAKTAEVADPGKSVSKEADKGAGGAENSGAPAGGTEGKAGDGKKSDAGSAPAAAPAPSAAPSPAAAPPPSGKTDN